MSGILSRLFGGRNPRRPPPPPDTPDAAPGMQLAFDNASPDFPTELDHPLFSLSRLGDAWTLEDAFKGSLILGSPGFGKTKGAGWGLARSFLENGFGGLVLVSKKEEAGLWVDYARRCGREGDLVLFGPGHPHVFNAIEDFGRLGTPSFNTMGVISLLEEVNEIIAGKAAATGDTQFWTSQRTDLIENGLRLLDAAAEPISLRNVSLLMLGAPDSEKADPQPSSYFGAVMQRALSRVEPAEVVREISPMELSYEYWNGFYPTMGERYRSSVQGMFRNLARAFENEMIHPLISGTSTWHPRDCIERGKIVVLDIPVLGFGDIGRILQALIRVVWQRAMMLRPLDEHMRPCFLWADEAQEFLADVDQLFQSQSREYRVATVFVTQHLGNLLNRMSEHGVGSLAGIIGNYFYYALHHSKTRHYLKELLAGDPQEEAAYECALSLGKGQALIVMPNRYLRDGGRQWCLRSFTPYA